MAVLTLYNNGEFPSVRMEYMQMFYISASNAEEEGWFTGPPETNPGQGSMILLDVNGNSLSEIHQTYATYDPFKIYFTCKHAKPGIVYLTIVCRILDDYGQLISETTFENVRFDVKPAIFYLKNNTKIKHYIETFEEGKYNLQLSVFTKKFNAEAFDYVSIGTFNLKRYPVFNAELNIYEAEFEVCELLKSIFSYNLLGKVAQSEAAYNPSELGDIQAFQLIYSGFLLYFDYFISTPTANEVWSGNKCIAINGGISPYSNQLFFPEFSTTDPLYLDNFKYNEGLTYVERPLIFFKPSDYNQKIIKTNRFIAIPALNNFIPNDIITYQITAYQINYFADGVKQYQPTEHVINLPIAFPFVDTDTQFNAIDFSCILLNYGYIRFVFQTQFSLNDAECAFTIFYNSSKTGSSRFIGYFSLINNLSGKVFIYLDELGMPQTVYFFEIYEVEQVVKNKVVENTNDASITGSDRLFVLDSDVKRTYTFRSEAMDKDEVLRYQQILHSPAVHEIIDNSKPWNYNLLTPNEWAKQAYRRIIVLDSKTIIGKGIDPLFTFELTFQYADNDYLTIYNS